MSICGPLVEMRLSSYERKTATLKMRPNCCSSAEAGSVTGVFTRSTGGARKWEQASENSGMWSVVWNQRLPGHALRTGEVLPGPAGEASCPAVKGAAAGSQSTHQPGHPGAAHQGGAEEAGGGPAGGGEQKCTLLCGLDQKLLSVLRDFKVPLRGKLCFCCF